MILPIVGVALLAFALSFLLTPICRNASRRLGPFDVPDEKRRIHTHPIPRIGGAPIFISCAFSIGLLIWSDAAMQCTLARLLPSVGLMFVVGLLDDILGLKPWQKLAGQTAASALAIWSGVQIHTLGGFVIDSTWWHIPITVVWLVACTNGFNLIDGVDGLAAGVGLFAAITMFLSALLTGNTELALATAPLVGALLGFLRYNFNPATIFLGDCGSLSIGFLLGCYGVLWSQKSATLLGVTAPLIALSIPLLDTVLAIARRFLRGQPIFAADRGHIHHRLLDLGLTPRRAVLLLYGVGGLAAACSLLVSMTGNEFGGLVLITFCVATWIGVQHLGYSEFHQARHVLFGGMIGRVIDAQVSLQQLEARLEAAADSQQCWRILREASRKLGFCEVQLEVGHENFRAQFGSTPASACWRLQIPLNGCGQARFAVPFQSQAQPATLERFAQIVHSQLAEKTPALLASAALDRPPRIPVAIETVAEDVMRD